MIILKNWKCPLCGTENSYRVKVEEIRTRGDIVYCDIEIGGCDEPLIIEPVVDLKLNIYKMVKITE